MKTLIFSISNTGIEEYTSILWQRYTSKFDIDYVSIVGTEFTYLHKYTQLVRYLEFYDKVCYVDADTIPLPQADNIFDYAIKPLNLCVDYSNIGWIISNLKDNECDMKWWKYVNTGVILATKDSIHILSSFIEYLFQKSPTGLDQTLFNKFIYDYGIDIHYLDPEWNVCHPERKGLFQFENVLESGKILHINELDKENKIAMIYERLI